MTKPLHPSIFWAGGKQGLRRLEGGLGEESHQEEDSIMERLQINLRKPLEAYPCLEPICHLSESHRC